MSPCFYVYRTLPPAPGNRGPRSLHECWLGREIVSQRQIVSEFILNIPLKKWFNFFAMMFLMNIYFSGKVCRMGARRVCLENYTWSVYHESRLVCLIFFFWGEKTKHVTISPLPPSRAKKTKFGFTFGTSNFRVKKKSNSPPPRI